MRNRIKKIRDRMKTLPNSEGVGWIPERSKFFKDYLRD